MSAQFPRRRRGDVFRRALEIFRADATARAERLPAEPPLTKQPPAPAGRPARSASQRSASFSAWTTPDASSQELAHIELALTTRSKASDVFVGAAGMKERYRGWSVERHAGARTSTNSVSTASTPIPCGVIACGALRCNASGVSHRSSGGELISMRSSAYSITRSSPARF